MTLARLSSRLPSAARRIAYAAFIPYVNPAAMTGKRYCFVIVSLPGKGSYFLVFNAILNFDSLNAGRKLAERQKEARQPSRSIVEELTKWQSVPGLC